PYGQPPYAGSGPNTGPYSGSGPNPGAPYAQAPSGPTQPYSPPYAQQSGPTGYPESPAPQAPFPPSPSYPVPQPHGDARPGDSHLDEVPGSQFVKFLKISTRRAFRLRIEPSEVLPAERRALETASPPITDHNLQAFLAWRRSVLFLVACALVPLTVIGMIDALRSTQWTAIFIVRGAPAFAEGIFCWICWSQLKKWAHWRTQRRKLFYGWLLFMLTPFIVFIYPLRTIFESLGGMRREALGALGVEGVYRQAVMPFVFAMLAMLQLAPKAISLMPGLIRASLVIKLLFPGSSAPGWLMVVAAPLYALLAYVILIIPYQFTGSGWFIAGVLGVIAGQAVLARAGFALAKPLDEAEALRHIKKVRVYYVTVMVGSALLIVIALGSLVSQLNLRATDVITAVLKFETNVLILTMIGADLVVTNLDRARSYTAGRGHVEEQSEVKIAAFVSLQAPPPPPPGPAQ
ncbi:MAG: hypothetical protein H0T89_13740, partial [Deltaproteobacteria bacterium]|nr:hypothetical protein [Deltaproteobacteria bacterium]